MKAIIAQYRLTSLAKFVIGIVALPVTLTLLLAGPVAAASGSHSNTTSNRGHDSHDSLISVILATARYNSVTVAQAHQYARFPDAAGIACIDNPGVGAMGIHYVNGDLVGSGQVVPTKPQALVYEPEKNGRLRLVAVEYIAFQQQWDATHHAPPMLFGQHFMLSPDGNRFGIPAFYSLHVWIWKFNPSGLFSMWNPLVHCGAATSA